MDIRLEDKPSGGRYVATVDGHEAEMTFSRSSPQLIIVDHTGVPDALRGRGQQNGLSREISHDDVLACSRRFRALGISGFGPSFDDIDVVGRQHRLAVLVDHLEAFDHAAGFRPLLADDRRRACRRQYSEIKSPRKSRNGTPKGPQAVASVRAMNTGFALAMGVIAGLLTNMAAGITVAALVWMMLMALREVMRQY